MLETWIIRGNLSNLTYLLKCTNFRCCSISKKYYFKNECKCFIRVSKHEKTDESTRRQAEGFRCFIFCLGALIKHDARVLKQLFNRASGEKENENIHEFFTCCRLVCYYEELYCYGDLLFRKGVTNVITMLWMIIKSRFNFTYERHNYVAYK